MNLHAVSRPSATASTEDTGAVTKTPNIRTLLRALLKYGASDLHLRAGRPPMFRINGKLILAKMPNLLPENVKEILFSVMNERNQKNFETHLQTDFSFSFEDMGRFRANVYLQRGTVAGVIRMIPIHIPHLDTLGLPSVAKELALKKTGLILITGSTGAGKSTSMAAMVNYINELTHSHIITIEDPIEFVYHDIKSSISQREVGTDAHSMYDALVAALRQDPDVITIGEMRSPETIQVALTAAETGHLVISTLHTNDARSSIDRILDVCPADSKDQVRVQLSSSLLAIISQMLIPRADGTGRVAACEVLIKSPTIEEIIFRNEIEKIEEIIASSSTYYKMQTLNQALERMVNAKIITSTEAVTASNKPEELQMRLQGFKKEEGF